MFFIIHIFVSSCGLFNNNNIITLASFVVFTCFPMPSCHLNIRTPPVPNAPSSEPLNNVDATFLDPHICRRLPMHAARHAASSAAARYDRREVARMANFKMYLLRQFCKLFESSRIFFNNTQNTQTQKMMYQNFEI